MTEEWLDKHAHKLAIGWFVFVAGGGFVWGGLANGWVEAMKTVLLLIGLACFILFTLFSLVILGSWLDER